MKKSVIIVDVVVVGVHGINKQGNGHDIKRTCSNPNIYIPIIY